MTDDNLKLLRSETAIGLVTALKGAFGYVIINRTSGEDSNGIPCTILTFENIDTGEIYSFPYQLEELGNGTAQVLLTNGGVTLEGHGDLLYTPVSHLNAVPVPDTIESLFEES